MLSENHSVLEITAPVDDSGPASARRRINLIRAVSDHAQNSIDSIDQELDRIELKKESLLLEKKAYMEMLKTATDYTTAKQS